MSKPEYNPIDRRPIQSRNTPWAEITTQFLVRRRISPNAISVFGMLAASLAGIAALLVVGIVVATLAANYFRQLEREQFSTASEMTELAANNQRLADQARTQRDAALRRVVGTG